jgi:hypothetical protein
MFVVLDADALWTLSDDSGILRGIDAPSSRRMWLHSHGSRRRWKSTHQQRMTGLVSLALEPFWRGKNVTSTVTLGEVMLLFGYLLTDLG